MMDSAVKPSVLCVYFTYTQQTLKVVEVMGEVLRARGCDVELAAIEFTDPRYEKRFREFPMPRPFLEVVAMIPAELRRRPAKIAIPDVVTGRDYDLVCIGSPTWWLSTDVPIRSFLESDTASQVLNGKPFAAAVCCRRYWAAQPQDSAQTRDQARRCFRRRHSLPLPGRPGALATVAAELPRVGRGPQALSRREDTADQYPGLSPAGGTEIRGRAGRPPGRNRQASIAGKDPGSPACPGVTTWQIVYM